MKNEHGSTLVLVLVVILVFSVLGLSIMANSVGERKRAVSTEENVQAIHLAENGLVYFENAFEKYVQSTPVEKIDVIHFIDQYKDWTPVGSGENPEETKIKARFIGMEGENNIEVTSKGKSNGKEKVLKGYYMFEFEFSKGPGSPVYEIADFTSEGAVPQNFSDTFVAKLKLGNILNLNLLSIGGKDDFYRVPDAKGLLELNILGLIVIGGERGDFSNYKNSPIIAFREGGLLGVSVLDDLLYINVLETPVNDKFSINVLIDGGYLKPLLLIIGQTEGFKDIEFKKFAVIGNVNIRQDKDNKTLSAYVNVKDNAQWRRFTFDEGLYVKRSLEIGGKQPSNEYSNLMLRGDMVAEENFYMNYVNLMIGDLDEKEGNFSEKDYATNIYVHGDTHIYNACIHLKNNNYRFGVFTKGNLTLENNSKCSTFPGLYYAEGDIEIKTHGKNMVINGGLIGNYTVDHPDKLQINWDEDLLTEITVTDVSLIPQGRIVEH